MSAAKLKPIIMLQMRRCNPYSSYRLQRVQ
jgi:hypothetical protein